jgi:hypothetical protein
MLSDIEEVCSQEINVMVQRSDICKSVKILDLLVKRAGAERNTEEAEIRYWFDEK